MPLALKMQQHLEQQSESISRLSVDLLQGSGGKILILIEGLFLLKILPFVSSWSTTFF